MLIKNLFVLTLGSLLLLAFVGCALVNPIATSAPLGALTTPTLQPTVALSPLASLTSAQSPTAASTATAQATSSSPPRTNTPATSSVAPGVYATAIRVSPPVPASGPDNVTFYVTFNNTTGLTQQYKWFVKIWSPDDSVHSFGETGAQVTNIPSGTYEIASVVNWHTNPIVCTPFYARVYSINLEISADPMEFKKPDGSPGPLTNFQVCPATPKP